MMTDILKDATARPWKVFEAGDKLRGIGHESGEGVMANNGQMWGDDKESLSNARLIVTAVNAYEPMLAALEGLVAGIYGDGPTQDRSERRSVFIQALDRAEEFLAQVKEQNQ